MPRAREVDAAKASRQRRARRYYADPERTGRVCTDKRCRLKLDAVLEAAGESTHPTCTPEARRLLKLSADACYVPTSLEDYRKAAK